MQDSAFVEKRLGDQREKIISLWEGTAKRKHVPQEKDFSRHLGVYMELKQIRIRSFVCDWH